MSSTSPSISGQSPDHTYRIEKKKRNRIPVSCGSCRTRKLRCNRQSPCENCVKRNEADSCSYQSICRRRKAPSSAGGSTSDEMQSRIDRLESLVLSLMHSKQNFNITCSRKITQSLLERDAEDDEHDFEDDPMATDSASICEESGIRQESDTQVEEVRVALGVMQVSKGMSYFRGETHINTILKEISEIKALYQQTKEIKPVNTVDYAETFPFAAGIKASKQELIDQLPPRSVVDIVIQNYLHWHDTLFHVIHKPGFFQEYEAFWKDPLATDPLWLALLFIMMHVSWKLFFVSGNGPVGYQSQAIELANQYRNASEAALVVGEFTKKKSYHYHSLRTLYLMCSSGSYGPDHTWLLMGWVVRIAMVMGLHRDGEQFDLPPFEIEIRRRLWTSLLCMDFVYSIQIGLPSMIRNSDFDTKLPLNLDDDDLTEDLKEMPKPRPYETKTDISYLIFKVRLIRTYGDIVAQANAIGPRPGYDVIMKFDAELRTAFAFLPSYFRLTKPLDFSASPPPTESVLLELLFHKAIVTLHRPYSLKARTNPKYYYSRKELISSCIAMLDCQYALRSLEDTSLKLVRVITYGIASYDFAHAAISLCVDLWEGSKAGELEKQPQVGDVNPRNIITVLERTRSYYSTEKGTGDSNCEKANEIVCTLLDRMYLWGKARVQSRDHLQSPDTDYGTIGSNSSPGAGTPETPISTDTVQLDTPEVQPKREQSLGYTTRGDYSMEINHNRQPYQPNTLLYTENPPNSFPITEFNQQDIIPNWEEWDSFMQGVNTVINSNDWWQSIPALPQYTQD